MYYQRCLTLLALTGLADFCLAACHCADATQAKNVANGCANDCNNQFPDSIERNYCHTGCANWEQSHNCVPAHARRSSAPVEERDPTADLVADLIERDAVDELLGPGLVNDLLHEGSDDDGAVSPYAPEDKNSCISQCSGVKSATGLCRNNIGSLIGHAF